MNISGFNTDRLVRCKQLSDTKLEQLTEVSLKFFIHYFAAVEYTNLILFKEIILPDRSGVTLLH